MALTTCDDCGRPVSDHAAWCPGCGRSDGRTILEIVRRLGALEETTLRLELRLDQIAGVLGLSGFGQPFSGGTILSDGTVILDWNGSITLGGFGSGAGGYLHLRSTGTSLEIHLRCLGRRRGVKQVDLAGCRRVLRGKRWVRGSRMDGRENCRCCKRWRRRRVSRGGPHRP